MAVSCTHEPIFDTSRPVKNSRALRSRRAKKVLVLSLTRSLYGDDDLSRQSGLLDPGQQLYGTNGRQHEHHYQEVLLANTVEEPLAKRHAGDDTR